MKLPGLDESAVKRLAAELAAALPGSAVIYLHGELGAGKTTFVRQLLRALGVTGRVKSPSYGLVEPYEVHGLRIAHLDLYRLSEPEELEYLAIRDLVSSVDLLLVEWPEQGSGYLPTADLDVHLAASPRGEDLRDVEIHAASTVGRTVLSTMKSVT